MLKKREGKQGTIGEDIKGKEKKAGPERRRGEEV